MITAENAENAENAEVQCGVTMVITRFILLQRCIQIRVAHTLEDSDRKKIFFHQLSSVHNPFLIPFYWLFNKDSPIGFNMMGSIIPN